MKIFALFLINFFGYFAFYDGQTLSASVGQIVAYVGSNPNFSVTSGTSITPICVLISWSQGYSTGTIVVNSPVNGISLVQLSNLTVGRVINIQCTAGTNSSVIIGLNVMPNIAALVCNPTSAIIFQDKPITTTAVVKFTNPLLNAGNIECFSNNLIYGNGSGSVGSSTTTLSLNFNNNVNISETVSCNYTIEDLKIFQFVVRFDNARIYFSPNVIITDSPSIQMNLFINFQPDQDLSLSCYAIMNISNPLCANITQYKAMPSWNISRNVLFAAKSTIITQTVSLIKMNSTPGVQDIFTVICCNTNYIATASVTLNYPANDVTLQASTGETVYSYLQFYQMSLCPCDLTVGQCDINCCCDSLCDCSSTNVIPISGPYGGYFNDTPRYSCQSPYQITTEPYHALLCVQFNTTNNLGYYYNISSLIQTNDEFQTSLNSATRNNFQFSVLSQDLQASKISAYSDNGARPTFLYLPKRIDNSVSCNLYNPITLFEPYDSFCPYVVTSDNCQTMTDPRLSFSNYLLSTSAIGTNCINNLSLININQSTPIYTFYQNGTSGWDDGYTLPRSPYLSGTCNSVVTSVKYTIAYNTTNIVYVRADVILGNVDVESTLYQRFVVSFIVSNTSKDILINQSFASAQASADALAVTQVASSGLYGYADGMPVLLNNSISMKTFMPDPSGFCDTKSVGRDVLFYKDSYVQCQYKFNNSDCNGRRQEVQAFLDSLLANTAVAIYGSPQGNNDYVNVVSNFNASVNISTPSQLQNATLVVPIDSLSNYCVNITTGVAITIYYSRQGKVRNEYIYNIVGALKSYQLGTFFTLAPNGSSTLTPDQITLTSSVEFVMISANIPGNLNTDDNTQFVCLFDVCIEELLYPWLQQYEGKQGFYEEAFGVMLLGLAIFLLVTTHPWW